MNHDLPGGGTHFDGDVVERFLPIAGGEMDSVFEATGMTHSAEL